MKTADIEKRLTALELALEQLKAQRREVRSQPIAFLERIRGTFEDDEAFREAMRLGRQWRQSQRPSSPKRKAKKK
jgi:hypothetical protein